MKELICNLHIHSTYSDGTGSYSSITNAALRQGVDVVIITDHNVLVQGINKYFENGKKRTLLFTAEEVHDQSRRPQKNHTLVIGASNEMAGFAFDPQVLIDQVAANSGLTFLAHPHEYDLAMFHEPDISWTSWDVKGFTGIELWNGFSEFKTYARSLPKVLFYAFFPEFIALNPHPLTIQKWDELLTLGNKVFAVGGSDSHALDFRKGFFRKTIFPYDFHFSAINNHLLIEDDLTGDVELDRRQVIQALKLGHSFVGYDLPASTKGFSFTLETDDEIAQMGDSITLKRGGTLRVHTPFTSEIEIVHNGKTISQNERCTTLVKTVTEPGYYRIQCKIDFLGKKRGWIYSNPIFCIK